MKIIKNGKISIFDDSVDFLSSRDALDQWLIRNKIQKINSLHSDSIFYAIDNIEYEKTSMKCILKTNADGIESLSLRRRAWLEIGTSLGNYKTSDLCKEFNELCFLVEAERKRTPDQKNRREARWFEMNYDIVVSYEPRAFEVGIFISRRK